MSPTPTEIRVRQTNKLRLALVSAAALAGLYLLLGYIDVLATRSRWPLHSLMLLGGILTFVVGWYWNRRMVEDTIREKSGPVKVLRPRHTLYWIRMEYWGLIFFAVYFMFSAYLSFRLR